VSVHVVVLTRWLREFRSLKCITATHIHAAATAILGFCREAKQQIALPRPQLAGRKGQAVQLLLQKSDVKLMQVCLCVKGCRTQHMPIATTMQQTAALMLIMFGQQHVPGGCAGGCGYRNECLFARACGYEFVGGEFKFLGAQDCMQQSRSVQQYLERPRYSCIYCWAYCCSKHCSWLQFSLKLERR
jgi:hypothetical protein